MSTHPGVTKRATLLPGMFDDPDPDKVLGALSDVLKVQVQRAKEAMDEEDPEKPRSEITKMLNAIFANGVRYAKLVAPARFTPGSKIQITTPGQPTMLSPQRVVADLVKEFEKQGIPASEITSDMIDKMIGRMMAIDVPALEAGDNDGDDEPESGA